ncbi:hypothetical protein [Anabaena sp. CCY 0017]|uniref:hypothetical protein n=1 Tax=Anabaena sp. CCY 0017 TaxID=3103866 RepID=UPI0039C6E1AC
MVTTNELFPKVISLIYENKTSLKFTQAKQHIDKILKFFTETLGDRSFFGGEQLSLAEIVAGSTALPAIRQYSFSPCPSPIITFSFWDVPHSCRKCCIVPGLPNLGISLDHYPKLHDWSENLMQRPAWQKTALSPEEFEDFKRRVKVLVKLRQRQNSWGKSAN